jgi:CRISPR/Cas system Type II protein with McrA/HNH and RuvC-like nuclease domain
MTTATTRKALIVSVSALLVGLGATAARADETKWDKDHPRREEVNKRLENQNERIHKEVKEGEMSKAKAAKLHKDDHQIRQEERDMASQNGGHITKQEQKTLNQQENAVSHKIGN